MNRRKASALLAELESLKTEAKAQGNETAAAAIEAAIVSIKDMINPYSKKLPTGGAEYTITPLIDGNFMVEYLMDGERNKQLFGTCGTGYKVFPTMEQAIKSGKRYIVKCVNSL